MKKAIITILTFLLILVGGLLVSHLSGKEGNVEHLKIMTYNIHYGKTGIDSIVGIVQKINPDVIALQECPSTTRHSFARILSQRMKYRYVQSRYYVVNAPGNGWVLAFVSRFPINSVKEYDLTDRRKILKITIQTNSGPMSIYNTHLTPMGWNNENIIGDNLSRAEKRDIQVSEIAHIVGVENGNVLVLGDFNMLPGDDSFEHLFSIGFKDIGKRFITGNKPTFKIEKRVIEGLEQFVPDIFVPKEVTLDYILLRGNLTINSIGVMVSNASDHYPLYADVEIIPSE